VKREPKQRLVFGRRSVLAAKSPDGLCVSETPRWDRTADKGMKALIDLVATAG